MKEQQQQLTIADVCALTGATPMTVYNWRHKRTDKTRLPCTIKQHGQRTRVIVKPQLFSKWCSKNGIEIVNKRLAREFGINTNNTK